MEINGTVPADVQLNGMKVQALLGTSAFALYEGRIQPDNSFQISLPGQVLFYSKLVAPDALCPGPAFFPEFLRLAVVREFIVSTPTDKTLGKLICASSPAACRGATGEQARQWWYATHSGSVQGTGSTGQFRAAARFELFLLKGWNEVHLRVADQEEQYTIAPAGGQTRWIFIPNF